MLWQAKGDTPAATFERDLGCGRLSRVLSGDRGVGLVLAALLQDKLKIPLTAWSARASKGFVPPLHRRSMGRVVAAQESRGAA